MPRITDFFPEVTIEDNTNEFKSILDDRKEHIESWAKTLVGYANGEGGTIYVGVADDGTVHGLSFGELDRTRNLVLLTIERSIFPHVEVEFFFRSIDKHGERSILSIYVKPSSSIVSFRSGDFNETVYIRTSGSTHAASPQDILSLGRRKTHFDEAFAGELFSSDDYSAYLSLAKRYRRDGREPTATTLVNKDLVAEDGSVRVGLVMFKDDYKGTDTLVVARCWQGYDKGDSVAIDKKEFSGSLAKVFEETMQFVQRNSRSGFVKYPDGSRLDTLSYPVEAVREALVNALAHRDYSIYGTQVDIDIFRDRLVITSPGAWMLKDSPETYDLENVPSVRRNPVVSTAFETAGLMEKSGSGLRRIVHAYKGKGEDRQPKLNSYGDYFAITLHDLLFQDYDRFFEPEIPYFSRNFRMDVKSQVVSLCRMRPMTRAELQESLGYKSTSRFLTEVIQPLIREGRIQMTRPPRSRSQSYISVEL